MGKTSKKLTIICLPPVDTWPEVAALAAQGHTILRLATDPLGPVLLSTVLAEADMILGPTCWRMDEPHRKFLKLAIESARHARYPLKDKGAD